MNNNLESLLLLKQAPGLGDNRINNLLKHYGEASDIIKQKAFPPELNIPKTAQQFLNKPQSKDLIKADIQWLENDNNHILAINDSLYPPLLKQISSAPVVLFVKGQVETLLMPQLAVVGSRNATSVGLKNCQAFCSHLAQSGMTITSGLAIGIDGEAHKAALSVGANTIAVMATGLDSVYPARHRDLAHQISESGALISEFSIGTKPNAYNFPQRNRIICGLALGTLVVEAGLKSGTLISARLTMESNRPVLAIPGSIHNPLAKGCHQLIKQGAKLVEAAEDIIEELAPMAQSLSESLTNELKVTTELNLDTLSDIEKKLYHLLTDEPQHIDELIASTQLSSTEVSAALLNLELEGFIQQRSSKYQKM